jgi:hypothetical protein
MCALNIGVSGLKVCNYFVHFCVQKNLKINIHELVKFFMLIWRAIKQHIFSVFTYLLTPWSTVLLEKLTGSAASQEIPRIFGT